MRLILILIILIISIPCFTQETMNKDLLKFKQLTISGKHKVIIKKGENHQISFKSPHPDFQSDNLSFKYNGDKLTIQYNGAIIKDYLIEMTITTPRIIVLEARNGAEIEIDENFNFDSNSLSLRVSTGGKISALLNNFPWVKALVQQTGTILLKGSATLADLEVKTGGFIDAKNLEAQKVNAKVILGGDIQVNALEMLNADISSFGNIYYLGSPEIISDLGRRANLKPLNNDE